MALLRVQAGTWLVCRHCGWLMWPHYDDFEPHYFDDRTHAVMDKHLEKHKLSAHDAIYAWYQVDDMLAFIL